MHTSRARSRGSGCGTWVSSIPMLRFWPKIFCCPKHAPRGLLVGAPWRPSSLGHQKTNCRWQWPGRFALVLGGVRYLCSCRLPMRHHENRTWKWQFRTSLALGFVTPLRGSPTRAVWSTSFICCHCWQVNKVRGPYVVTYTYVSLIGHLYLAGIGFRV